MIRCLAFCLALLGPVAARAHPHIFIEASLGFVFDDRGRLAAVRVEWVYDEFYTLLLFEDLGIDADGDLILTDDELARLTAQDSTWDPEYEGDLYGTVDGAPVALAPPVRFELRMEGARIVSVHYRPLAERLEVRGHAVSFQTYDPGYYAAFEVTRGVAVAGDDGCRAEVVPPDRSAATEELEALLKKLRQGENAELTFPAVGATFADTVRLTCAAE
jgi:polyphosphate kinase